jgi:hypothetical protein
LKLLSGSLSSFPRFRCGFSATAAGEGEGEGGVDRDLQEFVGRFGHLSLEMLIQNHLVTFGHTVDKETEKTGDSEIGKKSDDS